MLIDCLKSFKALFLRIQCRYFIFGLESYCYYCSFFLEFIITVNITNWRLCPAWQLKEICLSLLGRLGNSGPERKREDFTDGFTGRVEELVSALCTVAAKLPAQPVVTLLLSPLVLPCSSLPCYFLGASSFSVSLLLFWFVSWGIIEMFRYIPPPPARYLSWGNEISHPVLIWEWLIPTWNFKKVLLTYFIYLWWHSCLSFLRRPDSVAWV